MNKFLIAVLLFVFLLFWLDALANYQINIESYDLMKESSISNLAILDVQELLKEACGCTVTVNQFNEAALNIFLPQSVQSENINPQQTDSTKAYPYVFYPNQAYQWIITKEKLELKAQNHQGVSAGLYGLLQEYFGFAFYHPRNTIIPDLSKRPQLEALEWEARPRFSKMGFHLHTQHPLELTEALLDPKFPNGMAMIEEYIVWLVRNQQNYFEFNLLESIDLQEWPAYAKKMVDKLHERGIIAGLDLSLHMIQQKAFMLYQNPPASFKSKKKQIKKNVDLLFEADWDVWSVEFSSTEFTAGKVDKKREMQLYLNELLQKKQCKLTGREHVVKKEAMMKKPKEKFRLNEAQKALDKSRGILSHTVMFYTATEDVAPVYENENLKHMYDLILKEKDHREIWYYPESAYWITFDNSIPMLLLPYLNARLDDILVMDSIDVEGHLTFSSGWEWGYWLIDWSIARWSWEHQYNGEIHQAKSSEFVQDVSAKKAFIKYFKEALALQQQYIKDSLLIEYLTAMNPNDEAPWIGNMQLHPRPKWQYKHLMNKVDEAVLKKVEQKIKLLQDFSDGYFKIKEKYFNSFSELSNIEQELVNGLDVTALRSQHRVHTLSAIKQHRLSKIRKTQFNLEEAIAIAKSTRLAALTIVREQEKLYRYPLDYLTEKRWGHTCYRFGYLYTPHNLHYWHREEEQILRNRWGLFFKNIINIPRTLGIVN